MWLIFIFRSLRERVLISLGSKPKNGISGLCRESVVSFIISGKLFSQEAVPFCISVY